MILHTGVNIEKILSITGLAATVIVFLGVLFSLFQERISTAEDIIKNREAIVEIESQVIAINSKIMAEIYLVKKQLDRITELPAETKIDVELLKIKEDVALNKSRVSKISDIISKKPEEALSIILLEDKINDYRDLNDTNILNLKERVRDNYNLMLYLMAAFVIALISILLRQTLEKKKG